MANPGYSVSVRIPAAISNSVKLRRISHAEEKSRNVRLRQSGKAHYFTESDR